MSQYSLSVDDKALHPILLSDDISWPDVITERDMEMYVTYMKTHTSDSAHGFDNLF